MSLGHASQGEYYTAAYQISPTPFATSSLLTAGEVRRVDFGYISRHVTVKNNSAPATMIAVGFTDNGLKAANSNMFYLSGSEMWSGEIRTVSVYVSGSAVGPSSFSLLAGLTTIQARFMNPITGSSGNTGVG